MLGARGYLLAPLEPPAHVLGAISWHRYQGTATHEGDERVSTTEETRARATHDKIGCSCSRYDNGHLHSSLPLKLPCASCIAIVIVFS